MTDIDKLDQWFKEELARIRYELEFPSRKIEFTSAIIHIPERSNWYVVLFDELSYYPKKGSEPNLFQRKMMELFFGVKWKKTTQK